MAKERKILKLADMFLKGICTFLMVFLVVNIVSSYLLEKNILTPNHQSTVGGIMFLILAFLVLTKKSRRVEVLNLFGIWGITLLIVGGISLILLGFTQ